MKMHRKEEVLQNPVQLTKQERVKYQFNIIHALSFKDVKYIRN